MRKNVTVPFGLFQGIKLNLDFCSQKQLYAGLFEREIKPYFEMFSKSVLSAVDIGGGEGEYALYLLLKSSAKKVWCCEPDSKSRDTIQKNLYLNQIPRSKEIFLIEKFVSDRPDPSSVNLDSLAPNIESPCLVKIDIEGGELKALMGAEKLLKMPDARWIIETHSEVLENDCLSLFEKFGYKTRIIPNAWWRKLIPERRLLPHNRWIAAWKHENSSHHS